MGQAVNVDSLLNYIAKRSGAPINIVKGWYPSYTTEKGKYALNIYAATLILRRARQIGFGNAGNYNSTNTYAIDTIAAVNLYNKVFLGCSWNVKQLNQVKGGEKCFILENTNGCIFWMIGGGGGGGGGASAKTDDKNGVATGNGGYGANGGDTILYINNQEKSVAKGGYKGAYGHVQQDDNRGGWKSVGGLKGDDASGNTPTLDLKYGDSLKVDIGDGGGGGGGSNAHFSKDGTGNADDAVGRNGGMGYGGGGYGKSAPHANGTLHLDGTSLVGDGNSGEAGKGGAGGSGGDYGGSAGNSGRCKISKNMYVNIIS